MAGGTEVVVLQRTRRGYGFRLKCDDEGFYVIDEVFANSPAQDNNLDHGDRILRINNLDITGLPYIQVLKELKRRTAPSASLKVIRNQPSNRNSTQSVQFSKPKRAVGFSLMSSDQEKNTENDAVAQGNLNHANNSSMNQDNGDQDSSLKNNSNNTNNDNHNSSDGMNDKPFTCDQHDEKRSSDNHQHCQDQTKLDDPTPPTKGTSLLIDKEASSEI
eukprot:m.20822 g.20822  ORF g.20822 m.20822 type:complete len:217 (-) comp12561_c0_seq2:202-852(-)